MTRYVLVDLSNMFGRAKFGIKGDAVTKAGMCVQMVFRSLRKLHREFKFDHAVICTDQGSWRSKVYPDYKSARRAKNLASTPKDREEEEYLYEILEGLTAYLHEKTHATVLGAPQVEADDFIARWIALHPNHEHVIVSSDSDFVQLLSENVTIYDAMVERKLSVEGVTDLQDCRLAFTVDPSKGKVKVGKPDPDFVPEPEWWRKALFIKIVRGDVSDSVFSAFPGVRYEGKKVGIKMAWEDRHDKGFAWNNFMLQEWAKAVRNGAETLTETVTVGDEFRRNTTLIDLTAQPDWAKQMIDAAIREAVKKPVVQGLGIHFLKFCGKHDLPALGQESRDHCAYLTLAYPGAA